MTQSLRCKDIRHFSPEGEKEERSGITGTLEDISILFLGGTIMNIKTDIVGLELSKWSINYAPSLAENANNKKLWMTMRDEFPSPFTLDDANTYISWILDSDVKTHFAIIYDGVCIGDIHISVHNDIRRHSGVIGYWIGESYWGKGIMTAVLSKFTEYVFDELELERIIAKVFATNKGSIKVLEKVGFKKEGHFEKGIIKEGQYIDQVLYAKVI